MAAVYQRRMMLNSGLKLGMLQDGKPLLYNQHALANLFGDQTKHIPTQIVFPDETVSIGLPPSSLDTTINPGSNTMEDLVDDFQNRIQSGPLVVFATPTPASEISSELNFAVFGAFLLILLQSLFITSIFLGCSWIPVLQAYSSLPKPMFSQKWIYTSIVVSYCLPCLGILYHLPLLLSIQSSFSLAFFFLGILTSMYSRLKYSAYRLRVDAHALFTFLDEQSTVDSHSFHTF